MELRNVYTFALVLALTVAAVGGLPPQTAFAESIDRADWVCTPAFDEAKAEAGTEQNRQCTSGESTWRENCKEQTNGRYECRIFYKSDSTGNDFYVDETYAHDAENVSWDTDEQIATIDGRDRDSVQDGWAEALGRGLGAGLDILGGGLLNLVAYVFSLIAGLFVSLFRALLGVVGYVLDYVVVEFVIEMGKYITAPEATGVRAAWTIFRDLANIGIIGGLVATAIGTIVGSGTYNVQKMLARLILSALLVNFSYFVAGAIIDASNFLARAAYKEVICENGRCGIAERFTTILNGGVAGSRFSENPFSIEGTDLDLQAEETDEVSGGVEALLYRVMSMIFMMMTMVVFLSVISYLIGRFVAIIFLLVTSPVGIAGGAVPILKSYSDEWWKALWSQTMFAPVYFLLVGISLNIFAQLEDTIRSASLGAETLTDALQATVGSIALLIVGIGFLMTSLNVAKKMAESTERFKQIYDGVKKGTGAIGQVVIGGGSDRLLEGFNRFLGKDFSGQAKTPFGIVGNALGRAAQFTLKRSPIGRGAELLLKTGTTTKFGGEKGESYIEARDRRTSRKGEISSIADREAAIKEVNKGASALKDAQQKYLEAENMDDAKAKYKTVLAQKANMEKLMADLPPETYEALKKREPEQLVKLAPYIPSSIFKQLSHDKEIPKATRNRMKDARFKDVKDLIDQADRLPKNANGSPAKFNSDGSVNKDYKLIQDKLFNHFKYSGMKSEDVVQMMQHHHDLFQSAVLLDGGMTNGAKMAIIDSADFGDAQKEVAKRTWQKGVKDNLAGSGIETLMPDKYEEAGRDSAFAGMPPEQITQIIADANSTLVNDGKGNMVPQFDNAVNKMKAYFTGKQPMEVARQVHEDDLLSPAFAAAASVQAISALPQVMDPPYLAAMTDNIVNLLHSGQITDPQDKKRLQTALHYMTTNAGTAYRGYFSDALAKAGVGEKEILAGFNATGDEAPAAINPIPVYITDPPTSS